MFGLIVFVELLASKESFQIVEKVITVIVSNLIFPSQRLWGDVALQQQCIGGHCREYASGKYLMSLILDHIMLFLKCIIIDIWVDYGASRQEVHKQNSFSVPKDCAHSFPRENVCLSFFFIVKCMSPVYGVDEVYINFIGCCFVSRVVWDIHVSSPVTLWFRKSIPLLSETCHKGNALPLNFILCSISIAASQCAQNFQ